MRRMAQFLARNCVANGAHLATDVDSRTRLQTALDACPEGGTILYKLGGEFRPLSRAELTVLRDAVAAHVQMCFNREAELFAAIDAAETVDALETLEWEKGWTEQI